MPVMKTYRCPDCGAEFDFLHLRADEPPPDYCARCGGFMGDEPKPMPSAPALGGTPAARSAEMVQRLAETSQAARAELAARAGGGSQSEIARNFRASTALTPAGFGGAAAAADPQTLMAGTRHGPYPNAGSGMASVVSAGHGRQAGALTRAGQMGKY